MLSDKIIHATHKALSHHFPRSTLLLLTSARCYLDLGLGIHSPPQTVFDISTVGIFRITHHRIQTRVSHRTTSPWSPKAPQASRPCSSSSPSSCEPSSSFRTNVSHHADYYRAFLLAALPIPFPQTQICCTRMVHGLLVSGTISR